MEPASVATARMTLAQLAQFSTLAAANQTNTNLTTISGQISNVSTALGIGTTATTGATTGTAG